MMQPARWEIVRTFAAALTALLLVAALIVAPATSASAATLTLSATRSSSGGSADAASTCPTQGTPTPDSHCAGYDTSTLAIDQIVRTGDNANVRFDFSIDAADTGVVLTSTLPLFGANPAAVWTSIPAACASGSTRTNANRTLNCVIASPAGATDGSVTANLQMAPAAQDGFTFTVQATIDSNGSAPVASTGGATFTSSNAPFWNLNKTMSRNVLPAPFAYNSPTGEAGFAVPSTTGVQPGRVGGYSPLQGPVTWIENTAAMPVGTRLLNWGNYGNGCGRQSAASVVANPGYVNTAVPITNQLSSIADANFLCSQPGGANTAIQMSWTNPPASTTGFAHAWIMLWIPATSVPAGNSTVTLSTGGFSPDPVDIFGVSNYLAALEPTGDNSRTSGTIINQDNRSLTKGAIADAANPASNYTGSGVSALNRATKFQTALHFSNTGTVAQDPVQICDIFDSTVARLVPFTSGAYAVGVTRGPAGDPILAPPYDPAAGYNNTNNFAIDPASYIVEFAAGDLEGGIPTPTPQSAASLTAADCSDGGNATGWHSNPNDPAILAYATARGLTDPFDVINRVRITFIGGPVLPGTLVGAKLRFETRTVFRDSTTEAGETLPATTPIRDVAAYNYPQLPAAIPDWSKSAVAAPAISGTLGIAVSVVKSVSPGNVQAGAPGLDTATYTISPRIRVGEDVATQQLVRVYDFLPVGMRYVVGSSTVNSVIKAPSAVLPQNDGSTVLVWDLGLVQGTTNVNVVLPNITFKASADPLAPTPATNYNIAQVEAVAPDGTLLDPRISSCANHVNVTVPPTPSVPVQTTVRIAPPANYAGCVSQGQQARFHYAALVIGNAFLELGAAKTALSLQVEPNSTDGVSGAQVGWNMTIKNTTSNALGGVDIVDVLPYNGDTMTPASDFSGTIGLANLTTNDALSVSPNALPTNAGGPFPPRAGTTFYVTAAAPASIATDPYAASNLQGGSTQWCLLVDIGDPGCPATLAAATAFRTISGSLASLAERTVRIGVTTSGNADGDVYTNGAQAQAIGLTTLVTVSPASFTVVGSEITGTIWEDPNADGVIDGAEATRLDGVDVVLTGTANDGSAVNLTVQTDADGFYVLPNLRAGNYTVTVDQADVRAINPGYALTYDPESGTAGPDGAFPVVLGLDSTVNLRNVGFASQSLSGTVYDDDDNDGVLDADESGNGGVTVTLTGTDDLGSSVNRSTVTAGDGTYGFDDVRPGTYDLVKTQLPATLAGKNTSGTAGGTAGAPGTNTITGIALEVAENGIGYLFGELVPEVVAGVVYVDDDNDGVQDPGEPGIPNVTIDLSGTDDLGPVAQTRQTLADGSFTFTALRVGTYSLSEDQPGTYLQGMTATNGADGDVSGDTISDIDLDGDPLTETRTYSFGEIPPATVSGVVYNDIDGNGVQDAGEPGLADVVVDLDGVDDLGAAVSETLQTGVDGSYEFVQVRPGTYTLSETDPAGYLDGKETAGGAGGIVDNSAPGSKTISDITVGVGVAATGNLFGDVLPASLAGLVFEDDDNDGAQQPGEAGIAGVELTLTGTDDFGAAASATVLTLSNGTYAFAGLRPGTYTVTETQPSAYFDGIDTQGDAGGTLANDSVSGILLESGTAATGYLFGERTGVSLAGLVFSDLNGNGAQDPGEPGIAGVTIDLVDATGAVTLDTTVTLADGSWEFTGLEPGLTYGVEETQPAGYANGASVAGTAGGTAGVDEVTGILLDSDATGYLFSEIALAAISGVVWHDANDDGAFDATETPIAAAEITLSGAAGRTTLTNADGSFVFADLVPGTYTLVQTQPDNWADGAVVAGTEGGDTSKNTISDIVLGPDTFATGYGFGEREAELQVFVDTQTVDADLAPGPYVPVGSPVRWTYTVVNNGDTSISGIVVTDSETGAVDCPSTTLAPAATMDCVVDGVAVAGQYENTGTVTGTVDDSEVGAGGAGLLEVVEVQASDLSHYFGMRTGATVTVTVNGEDARATPGPVVANGGTALVRVVVENTGNVPLTLDTLDTDGLGSLDCTPVGPVPPGGILECTTTLRPASGNYDHLLALVLLAPDATDVAGLTADTVLEVGANAFYMVMEPGIVPPAIAQTGANFDGSWLAIGALLLLLGAILLFVRRDLPRRVADCG
ncbi:MAG TPA: SdrD B-like domain-containing protein [Microbacterium sp.]|uniref:SdrD B-like domain-containing protein n=1 Tax=Microbacterium sp. TaxID=51671 RepID=UPI002C8094C2|nr:SdrD B-like domain-containing protein [Microbacterium sp.]HWI32552.1 SdrD B-like domain-containing protein [Microbacterium sp.]